MSVENASEPQRHFLPTRLSVNIDSGANSSRKRWFRLLDKFDASSLNPRTAACFWVAHPGLARIRAAGATIGPCR